MLMERAESAALDEGKKSYAAFCARTAALKLLADGKSGNAIVAMKRAISHCPDDPGLYLSAGLTCMEANPRLAISYFEKASSLGCNLSEILGSGLKAVVEDAEDV